MLNTIKRRSNFAFTAITTASNYRHFIRGLTVGSFSQHGEDRYILDYFSGGPHRYVDIGASHPTRISSTYLLYRNGWSGLTIEPIRGMYEAQRRWRPRDVQVNAGVGSDPGTLTFHELDPLVLSTFDGELAAEYVAKNQARLRRKYDVEIRRAKDLISTAGFDDADLLSVDVEGYEIPVLESIDWKRFRPKMVVVETVTAIGEASDAGSIGNLLCDAGYSYDRQFGANAIYVHS